MFLFETPFIIYAKDEKDFIQQFSKLFKPVSRWSDDVHQMLKNKEITEIHIFRDEKKAKDFWLYYLSTTDIQKIQKVEEMKQKLEEYKKNQEQQDEW